MTPSATARAAGGICRIIAGEGNDTVGASVAGPNYIDLGRGDDTISDLGGQTLKHTIGGSGFDRYIKETDQPFSNRPYFEYRLGDGIELFSAQEGYSEVLVVGNGLGNQIYVSGERVTVRGGGGDDIIAVGLINEDGNNSYVSGAFIYGESGNDTIIPSGGSVPVPNGAPGETTYRGEYGRTTMYGGSGNDTADHSSFSATCSCHWTTNPTTAALAITTTSCRHRNHPWRLWERHDHRQSLRQQTHRQRRQPHDLGRRWK